MSHQPKSRWKGACYQLIGVVLIAAAFLKAEEIVTTAGRLSWVVSTALLMVTEVTLGLMVLSRLGGRLTWAMVFCLFCLFVIASAKLVATGAADCNCFGRLSVPPMIIMGVDVATLLLLVSIGPQEHVDSVGRYIVMGGGLIAFLALTFSLWWLSNEPQSLDELPPYGPVLLRPERWIGEQLPLMKHLDGAHPLRKGEWNVVLVHHDCAKCVDLVSEFSKQVMPRTALIEVPPFGTPLAADVSAHLRLDEEKDWFVKTPVSLRVVDGKVLDIIR